jgi:Fe-S-cluster-containing dehydrogenase component/DMSO reductase anchor subunit
LITVAELPPKNRLTSDLLAEQRDLSAVERFSEWHQTSEEPARARWYRDLIPVNPPQPGQQYAFEVDLDRCSGCKACVSACHSLNGLDDGEAWRDVGLLVSDDWRQPFQQTITTACHHCVDPACLNGCPVLAYDKDPITGIVRHLDDQCIGCQYCVLKCPYDVPKYSERRGIVRKCDLCSHRLAAGEHPACVQACPHEAIRITLLETETVVAEYRTRRSRREEVLTSKSEIGTEPPYVGTYEGTSTAARNRFLPEAPSPDYTLPTTRYKSAKSLPDCTRAADREELQPQPAHTPLVVMLVFSQLAVGLSVFKLILPEAAAAQAPARALITQTFTLLVVGLFSLVASLMHLGRPLGAWRSFLGLRRSWLSREVVAFGGFIALAALDAGSLGFGPWTGTMAGWGLGLATAVSGALTVFCSVMVYHDTRRDFWRLAWTAGKFFGTALLLGAAGTLLIVFSCAPATAPSSVTPLVALIVLAGVFKLAVEHRVLRHVSADDFSPLHKTALLLTERFGRWNRVRISCIVVGALFLPILFALEGFAPSPGGLTAQASLLFALCLAGELIERQLFFLAVQPAKMPGAIAS